MGKQLRACKACGQTIAKNAKTCPHCGAKNKRKHPIFFALLVVIVVILAVNLGGKDNDNDQINYDPPKYTENNKDTTNTSETTLPNDTTCPSESTPPSTSPISTSEPVSESTDTMRPEFKEAMDSYETFFKEYCDFMAKFQNDPTNLELLADYSTFMSQYVETMSELEDIDDSELNDEELKYYIEVTARINQMLIDVAG